MNIYQDLEDSLYSIVSNLYPAWTVIFPYQSGPEPVSPFLVIDVKKFDAVGRQYQSTLVDVDVFPAATTTVQDYLATVRFEFVGKYDVNTVLAEMAHQFEMNLRTPRGYELQKIARLSLFSYDPVQRLSLKRETETYMYYQLDVVFGYSMEVRQEFDYIESTSLTGVYRDAGREPDHVITNLIVIDPI